LVALKGKSGRAHPREPGRPPSQGRTRKTRPKYGTARRPDITAAPYTQRMGGRRCEKDTHDEKEERGLLKEAKGPGGGPAPTPPPTQPKRNPAQAPQATPKGNPKPQAEPEPGESNPTNRTKTRRPNPKPADQHPRRSPGPARPTSQPHSGSFPHCRTATLSCIAAKQSG